MSARGRAGLTAIAAAVAVLVLATSPRAAEGPPRRVVSMNLCADQLAMMLAGPGQLHSVSYLARDPGAAVMAQEARAFVANHGQAEEVFLMRPDLVLAGTYTTRATVEMLRRLGVPVAELPPARSFDEIRRNIRRVGALLHRPDMAERLIEALDERLAAAAPAPGDGARPRAATRYANGMTSGAGTLADEVVQAAGLHNLARDAGVVGTGRLALERLVMADPEIVARGRRFGPAGPVQAEFEHPAFLRIAARAGGAVVADRYWICGAPFTAEAVAALARARARRLDSRPAGEPE